MRNSHLGKVCSMETKEKMRKNARPGMKGRKHTAESNEKNRIAHLGKVSWMKGRKHTAESNEKNRIAHLGIKPSAETLEKLRLSLIGRLVSEETRQKIRNSNLGKISWAKGKAFTKSHREKIRLSKIGTHLSEETKEKIRLNRIGKIASKETRKKMSIFHITNPNRKFKDTNIEIKMESGLKKKKILYEKQKSLHGVAIVDFYLPESNIAIQCDGCFWHNCPIHYPDYHLDAKNRSLKQDLALNSYGITIYRFWEHEINENVLNCIKKIKELEQNHHK